MEKLFILKIIVLIVAGIVFYFVFIKKAKSPKDIQDEIDKKIAKQNKLNTQAIAKIVHGSNIELPLEKRLEYIQAFDKWQITQGELFKNASEAQRKTFFEFMKKHEPYGFKGVYSSEKPGPGYELVMADCFTEPFPPHYDMDDWNRDILIVMLMIFEVIKPFKSSEYYFHEKEYFVNHNMVQAIIMVDLYKKIK